GLSEIIGANPKITNPALIYPGQAITIPTTDDQALNYENEVVRLVNVERAKQGLNPLKADWELSRVARYKSQDMKDKNYFSHTSPTYGSPFQMMKNFGISYRTAGENIAKGQSTPQAVVTAWMNSSGHRANILNSSFTKIGVGYVKSGNYWTQMFIG
ncbi:MAG: CAP domain-containing protein, partial [Eubacteriales bacterium]|nr:CAP domain-containing protein [Eubacteriales bacterium]